LFGISPKDNTDKIENVKQLFTSTGSVNETKKAIEEYTEKAFSVLETINISDDKKVLLKQFGEKLMKRSV
jgi:geranylgeranyl diphosphate synthase type II